MKIKVCIVEDDKKASDELSSLLKHYQQERDIEIEISSYSLPIKFLEEYKGGIDILFFDIEMPQMDGMKLAEKLRLKDKDTTLIFVTNLSQYAIKGYDYQAYSFIVKPVQYELLKAKLDLLIPILKRKKEIKKVIIHTKNSVVAISINDIIYLEVNNHKMTYHLKNETYETLESMKSALGKFKNDGFSLVNQSFLLNLRYVTKVGKESVFIDDKEFFFSRLRKKEFMEDFVRYVSAEL